MDKVSDNCQYCGKQCFVETCLGCRMRLHRARNMTEDEIMLLIQVGFDYREMNMELVNLYNRSHNPESLHPADMVRVIKEFRKIVEK